MNKLLLLVSVVFINHCAYCQTNGGSANPASSKKTTHHVKHHHAAQKNVKQGEVMHNAPDQDKIDSMKRAKQKMVH